MMKVKKLTAIAAVLCAVLLSTAAVAKDKKAKPEWRSWPMGDRLTGYIGYYKPKLNTRAGIATQNESLGVLIGFEETLGLSDSKGTGILAFKWRISKRNELSVNYFKLDRSSTQDVELRFFVDPGDLGDPTEGSVELPISSVFNIESIDITYAYSVMFREKHNLALGLGLALQNLKFGFRPNENCDNVTLCPLIEPKEAKATAPLPTIKFIYQYAINDKWLVNTDIGYFALGLQLEKEKGEDISGRLWNVTAGIQWKTWKHAGFNLGYKYFDVDLDYERGGSIPYKAAAEYDYRGFVLGVEAFF